MDPLFISIIAFVAVVAIIVAIMLVMNDFSNTEVEDRLQVLTGHKNSVEEGKDEKILKKQMLKDGVGGMSKAFNNLIFKFGNLPLLFEQAHSPIGIEVFAIISIVFAAVGVVGGMAAHAPTPLLPVCALFAGILPYMWILRRRKKRFARFGAQLPDALELIARALRSGHSLASGIQVVVHEMPEPISEEFGMAYEEQNLGIPIDKALKNVFRRVPNLDFKFFVTAVAIQRQAGGDLAEILDKIGHIVRERFRIMGQVQALTGEGRISGFVLMALPIVLFFVMYYLNAEYMMLLFTEELGRKMIAGAVFLQILGAITIKKIIEIKI
ncbi:MAG: secretion protein [Rubinisphaera sp.]|uniref:type II secretion system F family protein n=1 Tax=Rubinisphaera sp. TaxID=2024857 RepID=UPI000C11F291|nr:type II secretion system F family protein [Rubinisphaera sp.]MBV09792.1 secretion protein [Rubinisphaera sp.]